MPLSSNTQLRNAVFEDLDDILELEYEAFESDRMSRRSIRRAIASETNLVQVIAEEENILGFVIVFFDQRRKYGRIYSIAIRASARGQGLGRLLVNSVEKVAIEVGAARMVLEARTGPNGPVNFYRNLGYHHLATLPNYYEDGADGIRMQKTLLTEPQHVLDPIILVDRRDSIVPSDLMKRQMSIRDYLSTPHAYPGRVVINLARSYEMLTKGYYVSLLAEARGEICLPSAQTLLDVNWKRIHQQALDELSPLVRRASLGERAPEYIDVHFGMAEDERFEELGRLTFQYFECPSLRIHMEVDGTVVGIEALRASRASPDHFFRAMRTFLNDPISSHNKKRQHAISIAMLVDPDEILPPSDAPALLRFEDAALDIGARITRITKKDISRLSQFDALFIRETTALDHHTYRFARKAQLEGLSVIDAPDTILRCSNKIYLNERLKQHGVPTPNSITFDEKELEHLAETEIFPLVIKIPDGSFSKGVHLLQNKEEFLQTARALFEHSDLLLIQEFMPTPYDWRIGILDQEPIFACRYYMAPKHWQIYDHSGEAAISGDSDCIPIEEVPKDVLHVAIQAASSIGSGLFGVDIKEGPKGPVVIEVNDNPNIDVGVEDQILGLDLYRMILRSLIQPLIESRR
jgi:glutathione synthase/RimK-type ligase-like ATP-grasp enzyme/ribosomal protein S18 acetylase RimI-like enzyme